MTKKLCLEDGCDSTSVARSLCNKHYLTHRNHGTLDTFATTERHCITDIDPTTKTGCCSICGEGSLLLQHGKQWRCAARTRRSLRVKVAYAKMAYGDGKFLVPEVVEVAYDELNLSQDGKCAICDKPCTVNSVLSVDHCHETGKIRGLLCNKCNTGIGLLGDNIEGVQAALDYLKSSAV